jgi:hypothetical protein
MKTLTRQPITTPIPVKLEIKAPIVQLRFPICHKIKENKWFFRTHFFIVVLSFIIPGVLSFYESSYSIMIRATNGVTIPLVLMHSIINFIIVFDNMNPPQSKKWKYLLGWIAYEVLKIGLVIIHLSSSAVQHNRFKLIFAVLLFLICEGVHFFISEFETPRKLIQIFMKHFHKLAWIILTLLLTIYAFSFFAYVLYKDVIQEAAATNHFIEGREFDDILNSMITMFDIEDRFNSYLIRAVENAMPGSIIFFEIYILITRCLLQNLLLAGIIEIFTSPETEKLMLTV